MNELHEQLSLIVLQFHWLRPLWLLAFVPLICLAILLWKQKRHAHQWQHIIAPELLPFLLDGKTTGPKKSLLWALIFAWIVSTIALAGPSWMKRPTPVEKNQNALVILLDLSTSMYSEDVKPSRIARARLKIADILRERKDGQTALVVYAGEAHTVTPLSDDSATILSLLPSLEPNIMPLRGSNTESAVERGIQLLNDAGVHQGNLLLVTDGVVPEAFSKIRDLLSHTNIHINILGVGTNQAAPVPAGSGGGFLHDKQGAIITTQLNSSELNSLALQIRGRYHDIANSNNDIDYLMPPEEKDEKSKPTLERDFDQWFDQGHWLVFLLLPVVLFCFRRGFILMLICIPLFGGLAPTKAYAFGWDDMWLTKDQQAARTLNKGDTKTAAQEFESPDWKAAAQYRAGDYAAAAENFAKSDTASAHYNRGNALAKSGKLEDAIKAYDEALKREANLDDAKKNRETVEKLLKQQKEQDKKDSDKNQDKKDQDKKDEDKKNQEKKNQDQKDQNKDDQNKQDQDKKQEQDQKDSQNKDDSKKQDSEKNQQQNTSSGNNTSAKNEQSNAQSSAGDNSQSGQASSTANSAQADAKNAQSSAAGSAKNQQMAQSSAQPGDDKEQKQAAVDQSNLTPEQKQALEQWLRRVPDDPGGLLRNKFKWQYIQNRQKQAEGNFDGPENHADQRY